MLLGNMYSKHTVCAYVHMVCAHTPVFECEGGREIERHTCISVFSANVVCVGGCVPLVLSKVKSKLFLRSQQQ